MKRRDFIKSSVVVVATAPLLTQSDKIKINVGDVFTIDGHLDPNTGELAKFKCESKSPNKITMTII